VKIAKEPEFFSLLPKSRQIYQKNDSLYKCTHSLQNKSRQKQTSFCQICFSWIWSIFYPPVTKRYRKIKKADTGIILLFCTFSDFALAKFYVSTCILIPHSQAFGQSQPPFLVFCLASLSSPLPQIVACPRSLIADKVKDRQAAGEICPENLGVSSRAVIRRVG
jgi:hypothetical protein